MTKPPDGLQPLPENWVELFHDGSIPSGPGAQSAQSCRETAFLRWNEFHSIMRATGALRDDDEANALNALAAAVGADGQSQTPGNPQPHEIARSEIKARWTARQAVQAALSAGYRP